MISFDQLKQRKIFQWAMAYVAAAYLILQVISLLGQPFAWPDLVMQAATYVLAIGFFAALVLAWYHGEQGRQKTSSIELVMLAAILFVAGLAVTFLVRNQADAAAAGDAAGDVTAGVPAAAAEQGSIAVLPFVNMSSDKEQEYFSDGLTEELLNVLAQIPELRVAARTSAFSFKGQKVSVDSIARALNVAHVLEGSVRSSGDRVRITAQLIDARTGSSVWNGSYDRELKDVFAVQDEITKAIVAELRLELSGGTQIAKQETSNPEAHSLMLKGIATTREGTRDGFANGQKMFEQAIGLDSSYARAYAQLASVLMLRANYRHIPLEDGYARARAAAERALEIDPKLSDAHTVLGRIADTHDWDFAKADTHFRRALELNPGDARAYSLHAWLLMRLGKVEASLAAARRSVELDPVSSPAYNNLGAMYSYAGKPQLAVDASKASLALTPDNMSAKTNLALTYSDLGDLQLAIHTAEEAARGASADAFTQATLGYIYGKAGRKADAEMALAALQRMDDSSPYLVATVYAGMGEKERAFDALESAVKAHDDLVPDLGVDPVFNDMRDDPRMLRLLKMIGLPTGG